MIGRTKLATGGCHVILWIWLIWGGAAPDSDKCACRMKGTCAKRGDRCNCDKNDLKWRGESGLVTEKKHLPVKQLRFGDVDVHNGFHEVGYHTLWKFKWYLISTDVKLMSFSHYFLRVIRRSLEKFQVINNKQIIIHISRISAHAQKSALLRISAHP